MSPVYYLYKNMEKFISHFITEKKQIYTGFDKKVSAFILASVAICFC